jgi:hypothetical protein
MPIWIPILPALNEILQAGPCGDLAFICGENGGPLTKESFGNAFRDACNAGITPEPDKNKIDFNSLIFRW